MLELRSVENGSLNPTQKVNLFSDFLVSSGFAVESRERNSRLQTIDFRVVSPNGKRILIHAIVKNISGAGWSWKPFIKRIQIKSYAGMGLPRNSEDEIVLLGGFAMVDGDYVYCAWNIFAYMSQKTIRSCYIDSDSLIEAHDEGFLAKIYADNRVYLSNKTHMARLIEEFIGRSAVTAI